MSALDRKVFHYASPPSSLSSSFPVPKSTPTFTGKKITRDLDPNKRDFRCTKENVEKSSQAKTAPLQRGKSVEFSGDFSETASSSATPNFALWLARRSTPI
jgi:hypothetical protein